MKKSLLAMMLCVAPLAFGAEQEIKPSPVKVTRIDAPEKALRFDVIVPAKIEEVWAAFTTQAGLTTWLWSDVTVDLREGGGWIVHYPGAGTGGGTIVSFKPRRQLVMHAMAPPQFPEVRSTGTTAVFDRWAKRRA
jgi:uncharacterized protein YndB with AHSA1/START domain